MRPVMPGKNATGTNTATSTMPMTTTAENTSAIASTDARMADLPYSRMWRSMFSMTTIASSTTVPVASTRPNSVSVLIEKPSSFMNANVPMSETGIVIAGISVLRQFCRNTNSTSTTSTMASPSVLSTSMIDSRTTPTLSNAICASRPGGKCGRSSSSAACTPLERVERVGARQERDAHAGRLHAGESQPRRVVLGAELGAADILDAHERAVRAGLDDDVLELRDVVEPAFGADAELERLIGRRRRRTDAPGGDLNVLLAERAHRVGRRQPVRGQLVRIEPEPHGELALAEDDDVADTRDPADRVTDVQVDVVADEQLVVPVVARIEADGAEEARRRLRHRDAVRADVRRHAPERLVDAVLDVNRPPGRGCARSRT